MMTDTLEGGDSMDRIPSKPTADLSRVARAGRGAPVMLRVEGQVGREGRAAEALLFWANMIHGAIHRSRMSSLQEP